MHTFINYIPWIGRKKMLESKFIQAYLTFWHWCIVGNKEPEEYLHIHRRYFSKTREVGIIFSPFIRLLFLQSGKSYKWNFKPKINVLFDKGFWIPGVSVPVLKCSRSSLVSYNNLLKLSIDRELLDKPCFMFFCHM